MSPMRISSPSRIAEGDRKELRCTNPGFKSKRVSLHLLRKGQQKGENGRGKK